VASVSKTVHAVASLLQQPNKLELAEALSDNAADRTGAALCNSARCD
jgi:hypothetical protein